MSKILLFDDEEGEGQKQILEYLTAAGFCVEAGAGIERGVERASAGDFALVILASFCSGERGVDVLRHIRAASRVPVIMLAAGRDDDDCVLALELGADDYLTRPLLPRELVARMRAILRRAQARPIDQSTSSPLVCGPLALDERARVVHLGDRRLDLTTAEFDLLCVFLRAPGRALTRDELALEALGRPFHSDDRSIDVHISNLRKKFIRAADFGISIKTVRGVGYLLSAESREQFRALDENLQTTSPAPAFAWAELN